MELFVKIVNTIQEWTILTKYSILDVWEGSEWVSANFSQTLLSYVCIVP